MFMKFHRSRQKGFTLVELIIVMGIIGILMALALARLNYNRERAVMRVCNSRMTDIKKAVEGYWLDFGGVWGETTPGDPNSITMTTVTDSCILVTNGLLKYSKGKDVSPHTSNLDNTWGNRYRAMIQLTGVQEPEKETAIAQCPTTSHPRYPDGHPL